MTRSEPQPDPRIEGDWLQAEATQAVCRALTGAGHQAWFVGGCVRDALLGLAVGDIDIATDAWPEEVQRLAEAAGLKAVPTGIEHGTITVVSGGIPHEVTTFRRDVETDGRRAVVAFADSMEDDARRRDFTMNALYADATGRVEDPLGQGLVDLASRHLRFIDDPGQRIREDYLRILRYFRFHARFGDPQAGMDPEALAAIAANADGLATLSRERVGAELLKLLAVTDPVPAVAAMEQAGVLQRILPGAGIRALGPLVHLEAGAGRAPDAGLRLAALGRLAGPAWRIGDFSVSFSRAFPVGSSLAATATVTEASPEAITCTLSVLVEGDEVITGSARLVPLEA